MAATTMHHDQVVLSDEQFSKLVELLTPGYECSKLMLAELQARDAERQKWEVEREHGVPAQKSADLPADPTAAGKPAPGGVASEVVNPQSEPPADKPSAEMHETAEG